MTSLRELTNGHVIVADRTEKRLALVDWTQKDAATIGRSGEGPGEYRGAGWLFALPGDTTLFFELPMPRWHLLVDARFERTFAPGELGTASGMLPAGASAVGILGIVGYSAAGRITSRSSADSLLVLLLNRSSTRVDTIARLKGHGGAGSLRRRGTGGRPGLIIVHNPLATHDQAVLFTDGWIAIAYATPYRVDWRSPDGKWTRGQPLPFESVRVTDREKCAAMQRFMGRGGPDCEPSMLDAWPDVVPPFVPSYSTQTVLAAPNGRLVIPRTPTVDAPGNHYDVIDRQAQLVSRLSLPSNEEIVGFGRNSVYIVATGELGLQTLRRHPWKL